MVTSTTSSTSSNRTVMGKDQFLNLLVIQLKNQDPMNPLDSQDFAAQLAQFSSLEQLTQLNDSMESVLQSSQLDSLVNQTQFSASLMGKTVIAEGDQVTIASSGAGKIHVKVGAGGGMASLTLKDKDGNIVAERDLGKVMAGEQDLALPGDLTPGDYTYSLAVKSGSASVDVTTYTTGRVDGVLFRSGSIILKLGGLEVALDSVVELGTDSSSGTTVATATGTTVPGGDQPRSPIGGPVLLNRLARMALGRE